MDQTSFSTTLDNIVRENKIFRIAAELEHGGNVDRKLVLRETLGHLQNKDAEIAMKARENLTSVCAKLTENQFKKGWNRLTNEQREEQIGKFYGEKKEECEKMLKMLADGKLKQKMVNYDSKMGKIVGIDVSACVKKAQKVDEDSSEDD